VDDDDEHDDPVLRWPDGRVVDTWREDYPYSEKMPRAEYEDLKRPLQIELVKLQNCRPLLTVVCQRRTQYQNCRYRTAGPMPAATWWRRSGTFGAASVGLEGSETCPLMFLQQSAQLGVLGPPGSLCVIHAAMIVDREDPRQARSSVKPKCR
jgi:hypothetical protein